LKIYSDDLAFPSALYLQSKASSNNNFSFDPLHADLSKQIIIAVEVQDPPHNPWPPSPMSKT